MSGLGLDIEDNHLRMVSLVFAKTGLRLESFGEAVISREGLQYGRIKNPEILAEVIKETWCGLRVRERKVTAAIPGAQALVRSITLPLMPVRELLRAARYHCRSVLPLPLDDVVVQVSGTRPNRDGYQEVTIVAARKTQVQDLAVAIRLAGLEPSLIEIRPLAACRSLKLDEAPQVLLEATDQSLHLAYFEKRHLLHVRSTYLPGFTPIDRESFMVHSVTPVALAGEHRYGQVLEELTSSLQYWSREGRSPLEPRRLLVTGSRLAYETMWAEKATPSWEVEWGNPLQPVESPPGLADEEKTRLEQSFAVALGLAARGAAKNER